MLKKHVKCFETNADIYIASSEIKSTLVSPGLPSSNTFVLNRLTRSILPNFNRKPVLCDNNESNDTALLERQPQAGQAIDTYKNSPFILTGSTVVVWREKVVHYGCLGYTSTMQKYNDMIFLWSCNV